MTGREIRRTWTGDGWVETFAPDFTARARQAADATANLAAALRYARGALLPWASTWSSDLLTLDGRPTDLLRDYATASGQPDDDPGGAQHVDRH